MIAAAAQVFSMMLKDLNCWYEGATARLIVSPIKHANILSQLKN